VSPRVVTAQTAHSAAPDGPRSSQLAVALAPMPNDLAPTAARRTRIGLLLAVAAGYCDSISFVALFGVFVSHMSGTSTRLAVEAGQGHWGALTPFAVVLVCFVAGAAGATLCLGPDGRDAARLLLGVEAALLIAAGLVGMAFTERGDLTSGGTARLVVGALTTFAMGAQSSGLRAATGITVNTTYVSGMLTRAGEHVAGLVRGRPGSLRSFGVHFGVWAAFVGGGVLGTVAVTRFGIGAVAAAAAILGVVATQVPRRQVP